MHCGYCWTVTNQQQTGVSWAERLVIVGTVGCYKSTTNRGVLIELRDSSCSMNWSEFMFNGEALGFCRDNNYDPKSVSLTDFALFVVRISEMCLEQTITLYLCERVLPSLCCYLWNTCNLVLNSQVQESYMLLHWSKRSHKRCEHGRGRGGGGGE